MGNDVEHFKKYAYFLFVYFLFFRLLNILLEFLFFIHMLIRKLYFFLMSYYFSPFLMGACPLRIIPVELQSYLWETLIFFLLLSLHKSFSLSFSFFKKVIHHTI